MLIVGAGGLAKQLIYSLEKLGILKDAVFYDDVSNEIDSFFSLNYCVIRTFEEAITYFQKTDNHFMLGIGGSKNRRYICEKLESVGGVPYTLLDSASEISPFSVEIEAGTTALSGTLIETGARIGKGVLLNVRCIITHDAKIGDFTEIAPNACILGGVTIGSECLIGASAIILPKVKIGDGSKIGAGAVVTKDVPDYATVVGIPARNITL